MAHNACLVCLLVVLMTAAKNPMEVQVLVANTKLNLAIYFS